MMFNFEVNQHLFFALASSDSRPLIKAIKDTKPRPATAQWGHFLRNHDELDLGRLNKKQRETVFAAFGPGEDMQLYQRGIRRRLAPMLQGDRRRLDLAYSLMMTLPGTPVIRYGDEIGMGRRPSTAGTKLRAHGYAVVDRAERRLHEKRQTRPAGHRRRPIQFSACQRRSPASRPQFTSELDGTHHSHAQGSSRDWLGRFFISSIGNTPRLGDEICMAQQFRPVCA